MIYIDPGELKSDSRFIKCKGVRELKPVPLPGLEEMTGADMLISPNGLPKPATRVTLKIHLNQGALLVQLKFGFDLIASIVDNRLKQSQAKMLATGISQCQTILLFIGLVFEDDGSSELMINGKYARNVIPSAKNFKYQHYLEQRRKWCLRGGTFEHIALESSIATWITSAYDTMSAKSSVNVFEPQQSLLIIQDWRNLLINLPGIGEQKAMDIYNWLDDKSFYGFLAALESQELTQLAGIGPATIRKIKDYLDG